MKTYEKPTIKVTKFTSEGIMALTTSSVQTNANLGKLSATKATSTNLIDF